MQVSSDADHPEHHKSEGQQQAVHSKKGQHDVDRQGNRPTHEEHIAQDRSDGCPEGFQRCRSTPAHHTEQEKLCQPRVRERFRHQQKTPPRMGRAWRRLNALMTDQITVNLISSFAVLSGCTGRSDEWPSCRARSQPSPARDSAWQCGLADQQIAILHLGDVAQLAATLAVAAPPLLRLTPWLRAGPRRRL